MSDLSATVSPATTAPTIPPAARNRLVNIELENYRAFRGRFALDLPNGCNLLVYGQNGSGKSSLFNAISDFLESPHKTFYDISAGRRRLIKHDDHRHGFNTEPASVKLSFSDISNSASASTIKTYEWSASKNDPTSRDMRRADKGKGCLDYKSLLRVHWLPKNQKDVNLFDLFISVLLSHYMNPVSSPSRSFADEWAGIERVFQPYERRPTTLEDRVDKFNAGFERVVTEGDRVRSLHLTLVRFRPNSLSAALGPPSLSYAVDIPAMIVYIIPNQRQGGFA